MAAVFDNINTETTGTEEEASEGLAGALNMEMEVFSGDVVEGEEGGRG